jgi:type VI secretion system ImpM family protein
MPVRSPFTLFGKLPAHGDFVRLGCPDSERFERWLIEALERARGALPQGSMRFAFRQADPELLLVGTWVPSRDAVGRSFPLCLLCHVPAELQELASSVLLPFYGELLDAAESALTAVVDGHAELGSLLAQLVEPHPSALPGLFDEAESAVQSERSSAFAQRVYETEPGNLWYALHTLCSLRQRQDVILDAKVPEDFDLFVWLSLLRKARPAAPAPSVLWSPERARALIMPERPSPLALSLLLDAALSSSQRWPLWTDRPEAIARAKTDLPAAVKAALQQDACLRTLIDSMSPGACP